MRARGVAPPAIAALVPILARIPQLRVPLIIDLPVYAVIGARIGHGDVPYQDLFDNKQPLIFSVFWFIDLIAPHSAFAIRLAGAIVAGLASLVIFVLLRDLLGVVRALAAALVSGITGASFVVEGLELNTEHLLALTGTAMVLFPLAHHRRLSPRRCFVGGVLAGLAIMTKAVAALMVPAALVPILLVLDRDRAELARRMGFYAAGGAAVLVLTGLIFGVLGALDDLWYANVIYNLRYIGLAPPPSLLDYLSFPGEIQVLTAGALGVGIVRLARTGGRDVFTWSMILWIAGALIGAKQGRREFPHYYAPMIAPASILLCAPLRAVGEFRFSYRRTERNLFGFLQGRGARSLTIASVALVTVAAAPLALDVARTFTRSSIENGRALWGGSIDVTAGQADAGSWIRARAAPTDRLFVEGSSPAVYWGAGLEPATRYIYDFFVPEIEPDFYQRLEANLRRSSPEWIVLMDGPEWPDYINALPGYQQATSFGTMIVLRRHAP
jgi:4-amino-4-deoxy-L-arabinose transferase-like glycosyltransferase